MTTILNSNFKNTEIRGWKETDFDNLLVDLDVLDYDTLSLDGQSVTVGGKVSQVAGRNGTIYNAVQTLDASLQPVYGSYGGKPTLQFSEDSMSIGTLPALNQYTIFCVQRYSSVGTGSPTSHPYGSNNIAMYKPSNASFIRNIHAPITVNHNNILDTEYLLSVKVWDGNTVKGFFNGSFNFITGSTTTVVPSQAWYLGAINSTGLQGMVGDITKLTIYSQALTDQQVIDASNVIMKNMGMI